MSENVKNPKVGEPTESKEAAALFDLAEQVATADQIGETQFSKFFHEIRTTSKNDNWEWFLVAGVRVENDGECDVEIIGERTRSGGFAAESKHSDDNRFVCCISHRYWPFMRGDLFAERIVDQLENTARRLEVEEGNKEAHIDYAHRPWGDADLENNWEQYSDQGYDFRAAGDE